MKAKRRCSVHSPGLLGKRPNNERADSRPRRDGTGLGKNRPAETKRAAAQRLFSFQSPAAGK